MAEKVLENEEKNILNSLFTKGFLSIFILITSFVLSFINVVLKSSYHLGFWDLILFLLSTLPLLWMIFKKEIKNRYTKWFLPVIVILLIDIFYYNNDFTKYYLPFILFIIIVLLYLSSMQNISSLYQIFIPKRAIAFKPIIYLKMYINSLQVSNNRKNMYTRIGIALLITIPVISLFLALFMSADTKFEYFINNMFNFYNPFEVEDVFLVPIYFVVFLSLYIYSFSNEIERENVNNEKTFDPLIIGIFLGLVNFLFIVFLLFQVNYLFGGEAYIKELNINVAQFAREGFFQLMWVMGIVLTIFLIIMSRFKGEKMISFLLCGLLLSTIVIGIASLKKMYLYQSIKGATVLRYYVEWFDYFLLILLSIGIVFILKKISFFKLLDTVTVIGIISLVIVSSINIDAMVASHNIEKFKSSPEELDTKALSKLSIDALPEIQATSVILTYTPAQKKRDCNKLSEYHFGYCKIINKYGYEQIKHQVTWEENK